MHVNTKRFNLKTGERQDSQRYFESAVKCREFIHNGAQALSGLMATYDLITYHPERLVYRKPGELVWYLEIVR